MLTLEQVNRYSHAADAQTQEQWEAWIDGLKEYLQDATSYAGRGRCGKKGLCWYTRKRTAQASYAFWTAVQAHPDAPSIVICWERGEHLPEGGPTEERIAMCRDLLDFLEA